MRLGAEVRRAVERTLEQHRGRSEFVVQEQRLSQSDGELDALAAIQPLRVHGPQRFPCLHQMVLVGGTAVLLQVDPSEDQPCPVGRCRQFHRVARETGGIVVLPEVVETARLRQRIGGRVRRGGRKGHEQSRNPDSHESRS